MEQSFEDSRYQKAREDFIAAYIKWITTKDDSSLSFADREQIWIDYCRARDLWFGIRR